MLAALGAAISGVCLTALLVAGYFRYRFSELVKAAEKIAAGDYTTTVVPRSSGLDGRLSRAVNDIAGALADTHDRATIDRLTGVANRQSLLAALFAEVERATRYERALSVAFVDIDHFKAVNDSYGHAAGDVVLRGVAQTIAANLRASDLIGRYGGEEFMLILTETGVEEGSVLTEKLRTMVQRQKFTIDGGPDLSVTISIGIAGGVGSAAPDGVAGSRRRCRDVLRQGTGPQPGLHLCRARRRRPGPARPDLAGGSGAGDGDRPPGARRRHGGPDGRPGTPAPLSRASHPP